MTLALARIPHDEDISTDMVRHIRTPQLVLRCGIDNVVELKSDEHSKGWHTLGGWKS